MAIITHGHVDHACGTSLWDEESEKNKWPRPIVVAHEAVGERFRRYVDTAGYNSVINSRQFRVPVQWPTNYRYPDITYRDSLSLQVGGIDFHLYHGRGETDDATWVWIPEKKLIAAGDFFIWASPNCGNPQKVQRYAKEWALVLRKMDSLNAEFLFPGHGLPIIGKERVHQALTETAELLEILVEQTLIFMNQGLTLNEIIHLVKAPERLLERPYLKPIYDEPEFIVRNIWRLYGGWYDGNPANLKPAKDEDLAREIVNLLPHGVEDLVKKAEEYSNKEDFRVACHLIELAFQSKPDDKNVLETRKAIYKKRVNYEKSTMSKGIFQSAVNSSSKRLKNLNSKL